MFRGCAEQALQTAAQVGGFADVWLGLRVLAAEEKDGGCGWDYTPESIIRDWNELEAMV